MEKQQFDAAKPNQIKTAPDRLGAGSVSRLWGGRIYGDAAVLDRIIGHIRLSDRDLPKPQTTHTPRQIIRAFTFAAREIQAEPELLRAAKAVYLLPDDENLERLREAILQAEE